VFIRRLSSIHFLLIALGIFSGPTVSQSQDSQATATGQSNTSSKLEIATFGGGCFWCVEAVFENMPGVTDVVSGYAGGQLPRPSYQQVSSGLTGHAEVCQIQFDPQKVSFMKLLEVFMKTHDPTTPNKQGPDNGPQYRSVVFYHSDEQKADAETLKTRLNEEEAFRSKVVTQIVPFTAFYLAEDYHQDYYRKHPNESYCKLYVRPKITKFKKVMDELERKEKKN
jgi:peptide-methionine (S)-S-oxide reductase